MLSKRFALIFLFAALMLSSVQALSLNVSSYDIDFRLDVPSGRMISAVTMEADKAAGEAAVQVLLTERAVIDSVCAQVDGQLQKLDSKYVGQDSLHIALPKELAAAKHLTLSFNYYVEIPQWKGNMMVLGRGHHWYPMIPDQVAMVHLKTAVYTTFEIYSVGDLLSKKVEGDWEYREYQTEIPVFKIPLVISRTGYLIATDTTIAGVAISLHAEAQRPGLAREVLNHTGELLKYYDHLIGPFHHKNLTMIEVGGFSGLDISSGLTLIGDGAFKQYENDDFSSLAMAIASQWIGAGVIPEYEQEGYWFFDVSLPRYLVLMNEQSQGSEQLFSQDLDKLRASYQPIAGTASDMPLADIDTPDSDSKAKIVFGKGVLIADKLRNQMGNKAWQALLADMYQKYLGKILSYKDFKALVKAHDGSGKAAAQLDSMLHSTGMP